MKKATINSKNNYSKYSKFAIFSPSHHREINNNSERISNSKPWKKNELPVISKVCEKFEKHSKNIALGIIFVNNSNKNIK